MEKKSTYQKQVILTVVSLGSIAAWGLFMGSVILKVLQ